MDRGESSRGKYFNGKSCQILNVMQILGKFGQISEFCFHDHNSLIISLRWYDMIYRKDGKANENNELS